MFFKVSWLLLMSVVIYVFGENQGLAAELNPCPRLILNLRDIQPNQSGFRHGPDYMARLKLYLDQKGHLPNPLNLVRFEDGRYYIHDGHHGYAGLLSAGVSQIEQGHDFEVTHRTYQDYLEINHYVGWVTPFDPRTHVRLPDLRSFKDLISRLRVKVSQPQLDAFIRNHPEAYSVPRNQPQNQSASYEGSTRDRKDYFQSMDQSMPMKVGHMLGAFPESGILWEPGTGSGGQAAAYAAYYPNLLVLATDLDTQSVRHAQGNFLMPNLLYFQGDALNPDFPKSFVDAVEDSSSGHHFVSYGVSGKDFDEKNIERYRQHVVRVLKPGGYYAMRDFVAPDWPQTVRLFLDNTKGTETDTYGALSKAELFEVFARDFRSHDYPRGAAIKVIAENDSGMKVFEAPGEFVANFMLRMQYTNNWEAELREQYTYYNQAEHVRSLEDLGLRVDFAQPYRNSWIEKNWWPSSVVRVSTVDGVALDLPPTNLILYARKPRPHDVKEIRLKSASEITGASWMKLRSYQNLTAGETSKKYDVISVPGITQTFVPFESTAEGNFLYLLTEAERPSLVYYSHLSSFDGIRYSGITNEAFSRVFPSEAENFKADFDAILKAKALTTLDSHSRANIEGRRSLRFLPSPGTSDELVTLTLVDMKSEARSRVFSAAQSKRVEVNQFISAVNLGSLPDGRLQVAAYQLAREKAWPLLPWFGGALPSFDTPNVRVGVAPSYVKLNRVLNDEWKEVTVSENPFLSFEKVVFERVRQDGHSDPVTLEFGRPSKLSLNTVSAIPYYFSDGELFIGFENYSLPSFQSRGYSATQAVVPAFRLSTEVKDRMGLRGEVAKVLQQQFNATGSLHSLGEGYFPSPGQTPEKVFPYALHVETGENLSGVVFVPWSILKTELNEIKDLHSLVSIFRLAHALGK